MDLTTPYLVTTHQAYRNRGVSFMHGSPWRHDLDIPLRDFYICLSLCIAYAFKGIKVSAPDPNPFRRRGCETCVAGRKRDTYRLQQDSDREGSTSSPVGIKLRRSYCSQKRASAPCSARLMTRTNKTGGGVVRSFFESKRAEVWLAVADRPSCVLVPRLGRARWCLLTRGVQVQVSSRLWLAVDAGAQSGELVIKERQRWCRRD